MTQEEGNIRELFTRAPSRPVVIAVALMIGSQFCGINAIIYYSTKIFESAGALKNAAFTSSAWIGLVNLLFTFVAIGLVDVAGRRPLLLAGPAGPGFAAGVVGWVFPPGHNGLAVLGCIIGFIAAFAV